MTIRPLGAVLISVSDKTGLAAFAAGLVRAGARLLASGSTARALAAAGLAAREVSDLTGMPELLGGRVKTLHPAIHAGLLARRDVEADMAALAAQGFAPIDAVVADLYPFEAALESGLRGASLVEEIDVGGPAMIRAAAKNHAFVAAITDREDHPALLLEIAAEGGLGEATRRRLAAKAFHRVAAYDAAIAGALEDGAEPAAFPSRALGGRRLAALRQGENPHQRAALFVAPSAPAGVATARLMQGKALSATNILDADAAYDLVSEFGAPAAVVVKHAAPCGAAIGADAADACRRAREADPVSAFGGVVALNRPIGVAAARVLLETFLEVVIAPEADGEALALLSGKPNLRILVAGGLPDPSRPGLVARSVTGGLLVQERDARRIDAARCRQVAGPGVAGDMLDDLAFAALVAKHARSNAIVIAREGRTLGIGQGQTSRIDAMRQAIASARDLHGGARGAALASDAFFPFADAIESAAEAGIAAIVQPGGSIRDGEAIAAADRLGVAMLFSGLRQFRH
jgi:phosphoribosylaminoimidazolecarboxamide formyltransferase/IMP cyclohydrolase